RSWQSTEIRLDDELAVLAARIAAPVIGFSEALSPEIDACRPGRIVDEVAGFAPVIGEIEKLFVAGMMKPDVLFGGTDTELHAIAGIIAGSIFPHEPFAPGKAVADGGNHALSVNGIGYI